MRLPTILAAVMALAVTSLAYAGLSSNIVVGGDFEPVAGPDPVPYFKQHATPDGGGPTGDDPIPNHRFSQDYDVGRWLTHWGQPSLTEMPSPDQAGGGFSLHDDPRDPAMDLPINGGNNSGYNSMFEEDIGNINRSIDPLDVTETNHILDNTMFRPRFGTWVAAPPLHTKGRIKFSFDFFYSDWDKNDPWGNIHVVEVQVYGLHFLSTNDRPIFLSEVPEDNAESFFLPLAGDPIENPLADGKLLIQFNYGGWYSDPEYVGGGIDDTGGWVTVDSDDPTGLWDEATWYLINDTITEPYEYYAVSVHAVAYGEAHWYFWAYDDGRVTDTFTQGWDNFNLQVSVQSPGDFNLDGLANLLDINDFVLAITHFDDGPGSYMDTYPDADLPTIDPSQGANPGDPLINLLDISPFVDIITGAGVVQEVPEPATLSLLLLAALVASSRRRVV